MKNLTTKFSEPAWLADSRLSAWEAYLQTPMPTARDEDWRRTDLHLLDLTRLHTAAIKPASSAAAEDKLPDWFNKAAVHFKERAGLLYQSTASGGIYNVSPEAQQKGVIFCDISTAVEQHADLIKSHLLSQAGEQSAKFGLLTKALFNCGAFLYIPRNVEIAQPFLVCVDFNVEAGANIDSTQGSAIFPRVLVVAEANSKADLVVMSGSPDIAEAPATLSLVSSLLDFHVHPDARLNYLSVQDYANDVFHVEAVHTYVDKDGAANSLTVALGGRQTKSDIATYLNAPGAESTVLGVVLGGDNDKFSYNTIQEHKAPDTTSNINFRTALKDNSSSVYQGIIRVDKVAQRTAAYQQNKNLLLGGEAKADSIPKLEILADDVKCSHGATVGPVDREQLFYLRSRGLTEVEAEELVVGGFFHQVLEQFSVPSATEWLASVVSSKIYRVAAQAVDEAG